MVAVRILLAGLILPVAIVLGELPTSFKLERTIPPNQQHNLSQLVARDSARHRRLLKSSSVGVVNFPLSGSPFTTGIYYTKVLLGSPPQQFHVIIDSGSYVPWVSCNQCKDCPKNSKLPITLNFFNPESSSTASSVSCSDQRCTSDNEFSCVSNQCYYDQTYGDGSETSGYFFSDLFQFDTVLEGSVTSNSNTTIMFGCSDSLSGRLANPDWAVDGIFGFGPQNLSIISQLASKGIAPNVFSHCLKGDNSGGGILVLGKIVEPNIVYTSLVPSQSHYNINLQSISVNGQKLAIDPSVFATSNNSGTIVDSGTTLALLAETAYDVFIDSINSIVSPSALQLVTEQSSEVVGQCYLFKSSDTVPAVFPQVSFNFSDGASMILNPQDYLLPQENTSGVALWCLGFVKVPGSEQTILGEVILKDKIVVYDRNNQTVGWVNYNCSQSVNVLTINGTLVSVQAEQQSNTSNSNSPPPPSYSYFISIIMLVIVIFL
ncbi:hypothetical protein SLA2020_522350 [Shorea laevis]